MLILGVTSKDKGSQLEALIRTELEGLGYVRVFPNTVAAGGNELDVTAEREVGLIGATHVVPLLCEAKAYADPVDMPTWQKFLGKLFLQRAERPRTVGMLVALNGINGNVRGSLASLKTKDDAILVVEGSELLDRAIQVGEVAGSAVVRSAVEARFHRRTTRIEVAYYGGGYFWIAWWPDETFSVVDGHGMLLASHEIESLRPALEASISGRLLEADDARARAEALHDAKAGLINRLLQDGRVMSDSQANEAETAALQALGDEPYCRATGDGLILVPAGELDGTAVARLFISLFEDVVAVRHLAFMSRGTHEPYVERLIDTLPVRQAGFTLEPDDERTLRRVAPAFPSVWITLSQPIEMITTHRASGADTVVEAVLAADRNVFWEEIIRTVRTNFTNVFLRGFLYDYMGIAELEELTEVRIKSKTGLVGSLKTETRSAVRQFADEFVGEAGTRHALVRMLPTVGEPWEEVHPDPVPLAAPLSANHSPTDVSAC